MKRIIITHFGGCSIRKLNLKDRRGMSGIATAIKRDVNGDSINVLISSAAPAFDGGQIIADALGVQYRVYNALRSGKDKSVDLPLIGSILELWDSTGTIVIVTHPEYSASLPHYLGQKIGIHNFPKGPTQPAYAWDVKMNIHTCNLMCPIY